jgi:D-alanine-D-alanine ligase
MQALPKSLHIGVIRGGISPEYDVSLKTGANVLENISSTHKPIDILITKDGKWHMNGVEREPERIFKHVDVVWNALHGEYGEDGGIQDVLNHNGVLYTGSDRYPSAITLNKALAKDHAVKLGIKTPIYMTVRRSDDLGKKAQEIWNSIPHPLAVKPANVHTDLEFHKVSSFNTFLDALEHILEKYDLALVEEYISGKASEVLVTENFRGQKVYAFPASGSLTKEQRRKVEEMAKKVHTAFNLENYSNSHFVVSPKRGVYFLEIETSPRIQKNSVLHNAIESVGSSFKEFFTHVFTLVL